jgi:ribokinase
MWSFDTLSIGSATLDIFLKSKQFTVKPVKDPESGEKLSLLTLRYGSKMDVDEFALQSGGGATNTAVGFSRLGLRAGVIAEIGVDSAAATILQELEQEGVSTELIVQEADEQTAVSALLIAADGGRSVATGRGAAQMLTREDLPLDRIQTNWVHLSSVGNIDVVRFVAKWCTEHRIGLSWNPGGAELTAVESGDLHLNEVQCTVFCVNDEEAARLEKAGYLLESAGKMVIVTAGRSGGKFYEFGNWKTYEPADVEPVQETGAGDAFITGVVAALLHDRRLEEAVQWGVRNAASVVQHMGAKTGLLRNIG